MVFTTILARRVVGKGDLQSVVRCALSRLAPHELPAKAGSEAGGRRGLTAPSNRSRRPPSAAENAPSPQSERGIVCQAGCGHGDFQPEQKSSEGPRRKY